VNYILSELQSCIMHIPRRRAVRSNDRLATALHRRRDIFVTQK